MKKPFLLMMLFSVCLTPAFGQGGNKIRGQVLDKVTREPLVGASVVLQSSKSIGEITDVRGFFAIAAKQGDELAVNYLGYTTASVVAYDGMVVELEPELSALEELVVVGYGTMRKSDLTGALSTVKGEDLTVFSSPNPLSALSGRAAGLQVVSSGAVDGSVKVRVRGIGTINNSDPLYVVDGFPVGDISHIAPTDIESVEVLKDASATAIYGSRGANGVIMLTTKRGLNQKPVLTYNGHFGVRTASKYLDLLDAKTYAKAVYEAYGASGEEMSTDSKAMLDYAIANNKKGTDWQRELTRNASVKVHNLSIVGGSEDLRYHLSGTYSEEEGVLKNSYVDKLFLKMNADYRLNKRVTFGTDVSFIDWTGSASDLSHVYGASMALGIRANPASPVYDQFGNWADLGVNPARINEFEKYRRNIGNKLVGNFYVNIDIWKGLSFKSAYSADYSFGAYKSYSPVYYVSQTERNDQSSLNESRSRNFGWTNSNVLNYNFNIGDKHSFNVMLGQEWSHSEWSSINATAYDIDENEYMRYFSASKSATAPTPGSGQGLSRLMSHFARVNYSFDNRYLITATIRRDGTSRFEKEYRIGYFPSVSAGWNLHEESFMKNIKHHKQFKIRAGWGEVGNQGSTGIYDYIPLVSNGLKAIFNDEIQEGRLPTQAQSVGLQWEVAEQVNVGADMAFFKNKLIMNVDYYVKNTKRMIIREPVPNFIGAGSPMANVGTIQNKGLELTINHENRIGELSYNVGMNVSFLKNKVTSLGKAGTLDRTVFDRLGVTARTEEGYEIAYYWGYKTDGVFNDQVELDSYTHNGNPIQPGAQLGDVKYIDVNKDGEINEKDKTYLGSYIPKFTGGFNVGVEYKNFFASVFLDFTYGNQIANINTYELRSGMFGTNMMKDYYENRWTTETPYNNEQRLTTAPGNNIYFSDRYVESGSYLRFRNIQLGYNIPSSLMQKILLKGCKVYVAVDNLYTITKYTGFNPQIDDQWGDPLKAGSDRATSPLPRTFTLGLSLIF